MPSKRPTDLIASADCPVCYWSCRSKNAQALAAKHTDKTGHRTWVRIEIIYGKAPADLPGQAKMFGEV